jgi:hypothetical protein
LRLELDIGGRYRQIRIGDTGLAVCLAGQLMCYPQQRGNAALPV